MAISSEKDEDFSQEAEQPIFPNSHAIIIADMSSNGIWPIGDERIPKQFASLPEFGGKSLFEKALERTKKTLRPQNIHIVAQEPYREHCLSVARSMGIPMQPEQIFTQISHKGKLVSILVALDGIPDNAIVVVFNSDHTLEIDSFSERSKALMPLADEKIILYTMPAAAPIGNRGYVKLQNPKEQISPIAAIRERVLESEAENHFQEWFVWDSGIFAFKKRVFLQELENIDSTLNIRVQESKNDPVLFDKLPSPSIYSGFFEKAHNVLGVQLDDITLLDTTESAKAESPKTYYMPWGVVNIVHEWPTYRVRKLTLNPEQRIPLQTHLRRTEAWSVGSGVAKITIGTETRYLQQGESAQIPIGVPHRLENPGKTPLIILENQVWDYLGNDDTILFEEWYGRVNAGV